jgi:hypothetical protein
VKSTSSNGKDARKVIFSDVVSFLGSAIRSGLVETKVNSCIEISKYKIGILDSRFMAVFSNYINNKLIKVI